MLNLLTDCMDTVEVVSIFKNQILDLVIINNEIVFNYF